MHDRRQGYRAARKIVRRHAKGHEVTIEQPGMAYQPTMPQPAPQLNYPFTVTYKGGWLGLFGGENQTKALDRALRELNSRGHQVAASVADRWSFWKSLGMAFVALITLGFYARVPNVILITEPIR